MEEKKREVAKARREVRQAARSPGAQQNLARSLGALAEAQLAAGENSAALTSATEAGDVVRALLAERNETVHHNAQRRLLATAGTVLAWAHSNLGRHAKGLTICRETLAAVRQGDPANADVLIGTVACLNTIARIQSELGDPAQSLTSMAEAVAPLQALARANPEPHLEELVEYLIGLGVRYSNYGHKQQALETSTEALRLCRASVQAKPAKFQPLLARALCDAGVLRRSRGEWDRALGLLTESVELWKRVLATRPDASTEHYALALESLAGLQGELGRVNEAVAAGTEAVALYRALAKRSPAQHQPKLATGLQALARHMLRFGSSHAGRAETYAVESVDLLRDSVRRGGVALFFNSHSLGRSLLMLAMTYRLQGRDTDAAGTLREAIGALRDVERDHPGLATTDLAGALVEAATVQNTLGNFEEAMIMGYESMDILKKLRTGPMALAQLPTYSAALIAVANALTGQGQYHTAVGCAQAAVKSRLELLERSPGTSIDGLIMAVEAIWPPACARGDANSLMVAVCDPINRFTELSSRRPSGELQHAYIVMLEVMSDRLSTLPKTAAAIPSAEFAVRKLQDAADNYPPHRTRLASALAVLGVRQRDVGMAREAAASFAEAVRFLFPSL